MKRKIKYFIIAAAALLILYIFIKSSVMKELFSVILISFIVAYSIRPLVIILVNRNINKRLAVIIILGGFIFIALGSFVVIIPSIFKESLSISSSFGKVQLFIEGIYSKVKPLSNNKTIYIILDSIYTKFNSMFISLFDRILSSALSLGEHLLSLAVIPIVVYYFLADGVIIGNKLIVVFPSRARNIIRRILRDIDKILGRYILSQFLLCAIIGVLTFIVLLINKIQFPLILSLLNAFFNIIPYFGPIFGALPAVLVALLASPKAALYTAVWLYAIQQIEGNIISPKLTGESVSMHPLVVILLLIVGGKLGGFIGMVLAIPVGVMLKILYEDINYYLF